MYTDIDARQSIVFCDAGRPFSTPASPYSFPVFAFLQGGALFTLLARLVDRLVIVSTIWMYDLYQTWIGSFRSKGYVLS
jgi:hypothetical protein